MVDKTMAKYVKIIRFETPENVPIDDQTKATIGLMLINKKVFCLTLEPPKRNNFGKDSCIPPGKYKCKMFQSDKFGRTFEVKNVTNRSYILFHGGNYDEHTLGCIIIGYQASYITGKRAVLYSRDYAFADFKGVMGTESEFDLEIINSKEN